MTILMKNIIAQWSEKSVRIVSTNGAQNRLISINQDLSLNLERKKAPSELSVESNIQMNKSAYLEGNSPPK